MPGPPPNPNARRRNARPDWRRLPADGCERDVPRWPLGGQKTQALTELWEQLWRSPQAEAWHDLGWTRVVARYTRKVLEAERPKSMASLQSEVRQLEDRLGLTPMAMRKLQWEIDVPAAELETPAGVTNLDDFRELYGDAGAG